MNTELIQTIVAGILSGALFPGLFALLNKKVKSPESQNDLARMGNEFASELLKEAKEERKELRLSIKELENSNDVKSETIARLNVLLTQKDKRINELEDRQREMAVKLQRGEMITLRDIFGQDAPNINMTMVDETP